MKTCDHRSVGIVVTDPRGRFLLLGRARPPAGQAPAAGHVDEHGSERATAVAELFEELGLTVAPEQLIWAAEGHLPNICRRPPSHARHDGHRWTIFEVEVGDAAPRPSSDEARGALWCTARRLQQLAERTVRYADGDLDEGSWVSDPGLEPVWVHWLTQLGYLDIDDAGLAAVRAVFSAPPLVSA